LAVHRQIRFAVSAVGPVRSEIAGITRNTLSSAKSYMSHRSQRVADAFSGDATLLMISPAPRKSGTF
jgi:hypothetical protein